MIQLIREYIVNSSVHLLFANEALIRCHLYADRIQMQSVYGSLHQKKVSSGHSFAWSKKQLAGKSGLLFLWASKKLPKSTQFWKNLSCFSWTTNYQLPWLGRFWWRWPPCFLGHGECLRWHTLPETNSSHLPRSHPKRIVFQPSICRCELLVSGRVDVLILFK